MPKERDTVKASARRLYEAGEALRAAGDLAAAESALRQAVEIDGGFGEALAALGEVLHARDRAGEAVDVLRRAAAALPDRPAVWAELADALQTFGRLEEAVEAYRAALALDAALGRAIYGLGCALLAMGRFADAVSTFQRILDAGAEHAPTHHNLAKAAFQLGRIGSAMEHFRRAAALDPSGPAAGAIAVTIPGDPAADGRAVLEARSRWAASLGRPRPPAAPPGRPGVDRPARVGYLSSFFHYRNWMKPVWPLINRHDRRRFEVALFSDSPRGAIDGGYREHAADRFHDISRLSNAQAAELIAGCGLDLLVDLNGFSHVGRLGLLAAKPAAVMAGWFNLYATTGMASFDFLIGDEHVVRAEEEPLYSERILRVAGSYLTFEVLYPVPDVAPSPCLRTGRFTFGCLASQYKITPHVLAAWGEILRAAPDSRLVLRNTTLGSPDNRAYVRGELGRLGVAPDRVELEGPSEHYEFLTKYGGIDLALDTWPYNGGTTTTEAIWQGVPVLTFAGDRWASRTSASILREGGLGEFVADDLAGFVDRAIRWATDAAAWERLGTLRGQLRDRLRASSVCDTERFARNMEAIYLRILGAGPAE